MSNMHTYEIDSRAPAHPRGGWTRSYRLCPGGMLIEESVYVLMLVCICAFVRVCAFRPTLSLSPFIVTLMFYRLRTHTTNCFLWKWQESPLWAHISTSHINSNIYTPLLPILPPFLSFFFSLSLSLSLSPHYTAI